MSGEIPAELAVRTAVSMQSPNDQPRMSKSLVISTDKVTSPPGGPAPSVTSRWFCATAAGAKARIRAKIIEAAPRGFRRRIAGAKAVWFKRRPSIWQAARRPVRTVTAI